MSRLAPPLLAVLLLLIGAAALAAQPVLGKSFVLRDPVPNVAPSARSIVVLGKESGSTNTLAGDPIANGAWVEVVVRGAASASQRFLLPAGAYTAGGAGWRALGNPVTGYSYKDAKGINGPVKDVLLRVGPRSSFLLKATIKGSSSAPPDAQIRVVPPTPGTEARLAHRATWTPRICRWSWTA